MCVCVCVCVRELEGGREGGNVLVVYSLSQIT